MIEAGWSTGKASPFLMTGSATGFFLFRHRAGRVIAFGGRAMEAGRQGKVPQFAGDRALPQAAPLFNHHRARKAAHRAIVVVEGYIDAIAVSEAGFPNVASRRSARR